MPSGRVPQAPTAERTVREDHRGRAAFPVCFLGQFTRPSRVPSLISAFYPGSLCLWHFNRAPLVFVSEMSLNSPALPSSAPTGAPRRLGRPGVNPRRAARLLSQLHQSPALGPCVGHALPVTGWPPPGLHLILTCLSLKGDHLDLTSLSDESPISRLFLTPSPMKGDDLLAPPTQQMQNQTCSPPTKGFHGNSPHFHSSLHPCSSPCQKLPLPSSSHVTRWCVGKSSWLFKIYLESCCFHHLRDYPRPSHHRLWPELLSLPPCSPPALALPSPSPPISAPHRPVPSAWQSEQSLLRTFQCLPSVSLAVMALQAL